MAGRRLFMQIQKWEYMWVALGGKPDKEVKSHQQFIDYFESETKRIQELLRDSKTFILKRFNTIKKNRINSKERVVIDEKVWSTTRNSTVDLLFVFQS